MSKKTPPAGQLNVESRTIFHKDNLPILRGINTACVDMIYLDPPFNKNKKFTMPVGGKTETAYSDIFRRKDAKDEYVKSIQGENHELYAYLSGVNEFSNEYIYCYLVYMAVRLIECRRVLKDTGSLYLHCDPTMSHYLKVVLDCIFGEGRFRNEIVWYYTNASRGKKVLAKSHDVIFWYSKSDTYIFNRDEVLAPFDSGMTEWRYKKGGQAGKNMPKGKTPDDVYIMPSLNAMSAERTGYPTQKPLALIEKFILAGSREGDVVLDPFCGCATTCIAAEKWGRNWIGIDKGPFTYQEVSKRLQTLYSEQSGKSITHPLLLNGYVKAIRSTTPPRRSEDDQREIGYVYIIAHERTPGWLKVGIANDPVRRTHAFQTGCPFRAYKLLYAHPTPDYKEVERAIHKRFNAQGEWVQAEFEVVKDAIRAADKR